VQRAADQRPRVVFVDHVARLSGGEIALLRLLPALAEKVDVRVILGEDGPLVGRLDALGIDTTVLPLPERLRDVRKATVRPDRLDPVALAYLPQYVVRLTRSLRMLDADLVHTNSLKAALYGGLAARMAGVPAVWHVRDRIAPDYLPSIAVSLVRTAARILPTAIVANSETTLATLPSQRFGRVLYNAVAQDAVTQDRPPQTFMQPVKKDGRLIVGMIGRLAEWKGQHIFLDAFAQTFRGTSVRGRIIGSAMFGEDAYAASLQRRAERLGISAQIEFTGFRDDVWEELHALDVLVHCSVVPEPFGQVVLEGMAAGLPVIAAAAGGPAELITSGVDGILTRPGDVPELAAALRQLANDPNLRSKLSGAARERSFDFTPERTAARLLDVYREILTRRKRKLGHPV
jgi:glycosyltransferase involved in cell wall biosynthesis